MTTFLPPEWAPQSAIQLTWPRATGDFADWFDAVRANFVQLAVAISHYQSVLIGTEEDVNSLRADLVAAGAVAENLRLYVVRSNDVWARDHGPITVLRDGKPVLLDFTFNGWGGKFEAALDNTLTLQLKKLGAFNAPVESTAFVLEGGGIDVDGQGTLLTTTRCLLAETRNPHLSKTQIEDELKAKLGVTRILWLTHGDLIGDDTDGHVDTIARFCNATTIAYQACEDERDAHYEDLKGLEAELQVLRQPNGQPYTLVALPLPPAIHDEDGKRLPAGYPNFLILNGAVLMPTYGDEATDAEALRRLKPHFPGREVICLDCRALINQYGSLHCATMQLPAVKGI
ncbi:MAG: agmatine deiminase family protein [Stagnimonas sp.]|nr:agmatine deiminase family protein [Stagnimonas sp.]